MATNTSGGQESTTTTMTTGDEFVLKVFVNNELSVLFDFELSVKPTTTVEMLETMVRTGDVMKRPPRPGGAYRPPGPLWTPGLRPGGRDATG